MPEMPEMVVAFSKKNHQKTSGPQNPKNSWRCSDASVYVFSVSYSRLLLHHEEGFLIGSESPDAYF